MGDRGKSSDAWNGQIIVKTHAKFGEVTETPIEPLGAQEEHFVISNDRASWKINRNSFDVERQHPGRRSDSCGGVFEHQSSDTLAAPSASEPSTNPPDPNDPEIACTQDAFPRPGSRVSLDVRLKSKPNRLAIFTLTLGALGVVFGDIGTSPLYAVQSLFAYGLQTDEETVIGAISALFWLLNIGVTLKYVIVIMSAHNHGQGGIMALTTLASRSPHELTRPWWKTLIMFAGMFGATLFYGDSMITPALSVMSALEGISVISPALTGKTMPIAVVVLIILFLVQRWGTGFVGRLFGPVMTLWFATLAATGLRQIILYPSILLALNPGRAVAFLHTRNMHGGLLGVLGNLILVITGGEALYADMGHFGSSAVRVAWLCIVLPALSLNYLGQGALILRDPTAVSNPFYFLFPSEYLIPAVILATMATVIASQAVISGCYSITSQAIKIGLLPRMEIRHMSLTKEGRIYIPAVNWILLVAVVLLCVGFRTSASLSSAYGMAVSLTMAIDGGLTWFVGFRYCVKEQKYFAIPPLMLLMSGILALDLLLIASCALKFLEGAWFPIAIGVGFFFIMSTWMRGMTLFLRVIKSEQPPLDPFIKWITEEKLHTTKRTAVYAVADADTVPSALLQNLKHYQVLHENNIIIKINFLEQPSVRPDQQIQLEQLAPRFWRILVNYGFKDHPDIPDVIARVEAKGLPIDSTVVTYFLTRSVVSPSPDSHTLLSFYSMALWRKHVFEFIYRNASSPVDYYCLPSSCSIELASHVVI